MKVVAVIPARFASTRFPGKPLCDIHGKPMIQWVYERTLRARGFSSVIVATDDERIQQAVKKFGGEVMMTSSDLPSGTDRVAAVADQVKADAYVNVQGDEPMIEPTAIETVTQLVTTHAFEMGTVMTPFSNPEDIQNPTIVKAVSDKNGRALYFSRYPIPYSRSSVPAAPGRYACMRHIGLYAYTRDTVFRLRALKPSPLELGEMLEQLRAMEDGIPIGIAQVKFESIGVDTPEDLEKVRRILVKS